MAAVYENVEKVRKAMRITKTHVARTVGLSLQGYRHIASGSVHLDAERLRKIADDLNINPGVFFDDKLTESVIEKIKDQYHDPNPAA